MTEYSIVLLVCLAIIAVLAILIYVFCRRDIYVSCQHDTSAALAACEVHRMLGQILATARNIERTLEQHRKALYDAHKQIRTVTKTLQKRPS